MKVSIGIPFYNPGEVFRETIASVLQQSFQDFELILLNDGSSDDSLTIAESFNDERIRVINDGQNLGLPARLNQLIELSSGEYMARMDADDLICPTRIEQQVKYLDEHQNASLVSTGLCSTTDDGKVIGYRLPPMSQTTSIDATAAIFGRSNIAHATIMARKTWYQRNPYNESAKLMEDYQLWIDAALKKDLDVGFLPQPLYYYREQSSVSPEKAITAYRNQYSLVHQQYFRHLTLLQKVKFTALMRIKVAIVYLLNISAKADWLLKLRNKDTRQNKESLASLQHKLDQLRGAK